MSQVHFDGLIAAGTENAVTEDLGKLILGAKLKYFFRQDYASRMYLWQTYPSKRSSIHHFLILLTGKKRQDYASSRGKIMG